MFLKQITLNNIRSYSDETLTFPRGSTLLSGDIGCGKSSILLAIEFALFGTARPDLPGEALLRKGTTSGFVELSFMVNDQNIVIHRKLKKEKNTIKQLSGHIINNNVKKELTPVELKAEIVQLLGYPEEFITKNKNYIFRYTVYTPQEEMRFVLQEHPDVRLDVLRKIFNIDKYKTIRENVQLYLKKIRTRIAILKTKTEPLEDKKNKREELNKEKEQLQKELNIILPKLQSVQEDIIQNNMQQEILEKEQTLFIELKQEFSLKKTVIQEKKQQYEELQNKEQQLKSKISSFLFSKDIVKETIQQQVHELEQQKSTLLQKKTSLQEKVAYIQRMIKEQQTELKMYEEDVSTLGEKQTQHQEMNNKLKKKEDIKSKKVQLQELLERTSELITRNKTILSHSQDVYKKIDSLDTCPTCLRPISKKHKEKTQSQEKEKIEQAEQLLFELNKKKTEIMEESSIMNEKIEELIHTENRFTRIALEIEHLLKKQHQTETIQENITSYVKENNELMQQLEILGKQNNIEHINEEIKKKQVTVQQLTEKEFLEQQIKDIVGHKKKVVEEIGIVEKELLLIQEKQKTVKDVTEEIANIKKSGIDLVQKEKKLSVRKAELDTKYKHITEQKENVEKEIVELTEMKNKLVRVKETYSWVEKFFIPLTLTIEKHVLIHIHQLFNQLFQEWFAILIDDEHMYARIDDSFSPVIEQNGHEIHFVHLSGGERTSASLAYRLALNKVINDIIHQITTKDVIILDEPTDGFSSEQLDKVRDVLERLNLKQTIIVSHEEKIESFVENVVRVSKEGNESVVY